MTIHQLALYGRDWEKDGSRHVQVLTPHIAAGISPGFKNRRVSKTHPNEDALAVASNGNHIFMAVADAHWGRESADIAISLCEKAFPGWLEQGNFSKQRGWDLFHDIEIAIFEKFIDRAWESTSETSLILAHIDLEKKLLEFIEYGDSVLIAVDPKEGFFLSENQSQWLGVRTYLGHATPQPGERQPPGWTPPPLSSPLPPVELKYKYTAFELTKPVHIILCSDGLTEPIYGVGGIRLDNFSDMVGSHKNIEALANTMMDEALRRDRRYGGDKNRGGEDNVAFVVVDCQV